VSSSHFNLSRWVHNRIYSDKDQTLCSRAFYRQYSCRLWLAFRVAMDILFWVYERKHCRRSFDRYW